MKPVIYVLASDLQKVGKGIMTLAAVMLMAWSFISVFLFLEWLLPGGDAPTVTRHWVAIIYGGIIVGFTATTPIALWAHSVFERAKKHDRP